MSVSIRDVGPGDYVKDENGELCEIRVVHAVEPDKPLPSPKKGGWWITTTDGREIDMFRALSYHKREEIESL